MISPESRMFCRLDNMPGSEQEQKRQEALKELGLLESESIPIFEEATQTAAHFLDAPICILGIMDRDRQLFKSAVGLSRIGLMNDLASSRQLPRQEAFCTHVVDSHQVLAVNDVTNHPALANSLLAQRYGIRSYVGVPLVTSSGFCVGSLAIMGLAPRTFTAKEIEFLELTARWCMSEFERNRLLKKQPSSSAYASAGDVFIQAESLRLGAIGAVKANLITQMTQELRTPLTSILGMASVLNREIYGPLTDKQKKYMDIVHNSGQYLLTLVNEILELGGLDDSSDYLDLSPVDIEMLCQQAISTLIQAAERRDQQIRLTVEPGNRIWLLDKDRVRQLLYHLVFSVIQASSTDSIIRIHVSRKRKQLSITVWTSHPWLGDGLPHTDLHAHPLLNPVSKAVALDERFSEAEVEDEMGSFNGESEMGYKTKSNEPKPDASRQSLGLTLSRCLAEAHGGSLTLQGSPEAGYRYVISLPQLAEEEAVLD